MDQRRPYQILFLCTGNSARSILAEYLLRKLGGGRFVTWSAGAQPKGEVNPLALQVLRDLYDIDASDARSKSWEELSGQRFDFVITVCDRARESCPVWPGQPITAHWGMEDPAEVEGSLAEKQRAFRHAAIEIQRRLDLFRSLPIEKLSWLQVDRLTKQIGASPTGAPLDLRSGTGPDPGPVMTQGELPPQRR
jgi:arsenate reductase